MKFPEKIVFDGFVNDSMTPSAVVVAVLCLWFVCRVMMLDWLIDTRPKQ